MKKTAVLLIALVSILELISLNYSYTQEIASTNNDFAFLDKAKKIKSGFPECTEPSNIEIYRFDQEKIEFTWSGIKAPTNGIRYLVRYRYISAGNAYPWREKLIASGNSCVINNPEKDYVIEIEVKKLCDGTGADYENSSDWVQVLKLELKAITSRAEYNSGVEECTWVLGASADKQSDGSYNVTINTIAPPNNPFWRYMIQYKKCSSNATFQNIFVLTGNTATVPAAPEGICEMAVRIIWGGSGEQYENWCNWKSIILNTNNDPPPSNNGTPCGTGTTESISITTPLTTGQTGQVWTVSGLSFTVSTLSQPNNPQGIYTGTGVLTFPFGNKELAVSFSGITVNTLRQVINGEIRGVSGQLTCHKTGSPINIGGDICLPKTNKEGWNADGTWGATGLTTDPYGFDKDGKYKKLPPYDGYKTGDPYDENFDPYGFDKDGINRETGTIYGPKPNECTREGKDKSGNKCDPSNGKGPYWWLNGGGFTEDGKRYAEALGESLKVHIVTVLNVLKLDATTKGGLVRDDCNALRTTINTNMGAGWDAEFIKGSADKYFAEGMSKNFASEPKELETKIARRTGQDELEKAHVNLYKCDVKLEKYKKLIEDIDKLLDEPNLSDLTGTIKDKIKKLSKEEIAVFDSDPQKFLDWLKEELKIIINPTDKSLFGIKWNKAGNNNAPLDNQLEQLDFEKIYSTTADLDDNIELTEVEFNEELNSRIESGQKTIFGLHRALWYQENELNSHFLKDEPPCIETTNKMPITITKTIADEEQSIYFDNIVFTPTQGSCDIYFVMNINKTGGKYVFEATGVGIGNGGLLSDIKLRMLNDIKIRVNNTTAINIYGTDPDTYVSFDCNGLKEIGIKADVEFCRSFLIPLDPGTNEIDKDETHRVKASFTTKIESWNRLMVRINIGGFVVTSAPDVKWALSNAIFDFSDQESPGVLLPPNYGGDFVESNGNPKPTWRGVYIEKIQATVPKKFSKSGGQPITVGVDKIIFDAMGFSGTLSASPVLAMSEGSIGGWGLSINTMSISILKNELVGGSMAGQINIPTFSENLNYSAQIHSNGKYEFLVSTTGELTAELWAAKVTLEKNCSVKISNKEDDFNILATLNGNITVDGKMSGINIKVPDIKFKGVEIGNKDPYFSPGTFTVTGSIGIKCGGFEITAEEIGLVKGASNKEVKLHVKAKVALTDLAMGSIGGAAYLNIVGKLNDDDNDHHKWEYDKIQLTGIEIDGNISGNHVYGSLQFYDLTDNPLYGTGFKGSVHCAFKGLAEVNVFATFGHFPEPIAYKYFCVDAMAYLEHPIGMGALALYGFGGGLYYHMTRSPIAALKKENYEPGTILKAGVAPSGVTYTPNPTFGIGIRATLALSANVEEAFNCNITFGAEFYSEGGIANVTLDGNGRLMDKLEFTQAPSKDDGKKPNNSMISANLHLEYNFDSKVFDGKLEVFANVGGVMKGAMTNDKMVDAEMHFGDGSWYIWIGQPKTPCGVVLSVPGLGQLAKSQSYLDIGTSVPDIIPLNEKGFAGLDAAKLTAKGRNSGAGFAFGAALDIGFDEKSFLIFYAKLKLNLGFDLMVGKYSGVQCAESGGGSSGLGINGWYAQGQAWASIDANVGIKVKVFGVKKKYEIFSLNAGTALVMKLPNPFYAYGQIKGEYRILAGAVKGKCNFKFEIGEPCEVVGGAQELEADVILSIDPDNGGEKQDVKVKPQAAFSVPLGEPQSETNESGGTDIYVAKLKSVSLKNSDDVEIPGRQNLWSDKQSFFYLPYYFLPGNDTFKFKIEVDVFKNGTLDHTESKESKFITDGYPDNISLDNITGSYPQNGMKYFLQKECGDAKGFIQLELGQPDLFYGAQDGDIRAKFISGSQSVETAASYNFGASRIDFSIPNLAHNQDYILDIIDTRKTGSNTQNKSVLVEIKFHTSKFDSFKEKVEDFVSHSNLVTQTNYDHKLVSSPTEPFDMEFLTIYPGENQWFLEKIAGYLTGEPTDCPKPLADAIDYLANLSSGLELRNNELKWYFGSSTLLNMKSLKEMYNANLKSIDKTNKFHQGCSTLDGIENFNLNSTPYGDVIGILMYTPPTRSSATSIVRIDLKNKTVK